MGSNATSYVRVYNDGDETGTYRLEVKGNASLVTFLESEVITIPAHQNRKVTVRYVLPPSPAHYSGSIVVSLEGGQIIPSISVDIDIVSRIPEGNRPPSVRILSPQRGNELSGRVEIRVSAYDPDGDDLNVSIYVDSELVANSTSYSWQTKRWRNGPHVIRATASDSLAECETNLTVFIRNSRTSLYTTAIILFAAAAISLGAAIFLARRHAREVHEKTAKSASTGARKRRRYLSDSCPEVERPLFGQQLRKRGRAGILGTY